MPSGGWPGWVVPLPAHPRWLVLLNTSHTLFSALKPQQTLSPASFHHQARQADLPHGSVDCSLSCRPARLMAKSCPEGQAGPDCPEPGCFSLCCGQRAGKNLLHCFPTWPEPAGPILKVPWLDGLSQGAKLRKKKLEVGGRTSSPPAQPADQHPASMARPQGWCPPICWTLPGWAPTSASSLSPHDPSPSQDADQHHL